MRRSDAYLPTTRDGGGVERDDVRLAVRAGLVRQFGRLDVAGVDVLLFDDADQTIGERFAESDLIGVPTKVVLGNHYADTGDVELETRDGEMRYRSLEAAIAECTELG